jgi:uncharacterized LabA/DUF88 family protein
MVEKLRAYVFIDASNPHYYLRKAGWQIYWLKFKAYCEGLYQAPSFFYYEGVPSKGQYLDIHPDHGIPEFSEAKKKKLNYFKFLKGIDFKVRHKPVGRLYDSTSGQFKHKCNFDVELTIDALDNLEKYDCFVLVSGDGDFVKLVRYLKGKKKKTVVIAASERLSWNLEKAANQVIYLDDLKDRIRL